MAQQSTAADTTTENDPPATEWQSKTVSEKTAFLVPLIGKRVRYVEERHYRMGREIFGEHFPMVWQEGQLTGFEAVGNGARDPAAVFITGYSNLFSKNLTRAVRFDAIYDIEPLPEESPDAAAEGPDFDGADVYEAYEVACPHCGKKLRIVQRATVEKIWEEEVAGDAS